MNINYTAMNRFQRAVQSIPRPGGNGYHPRLLGLANLGVRAGITPTELAATIRTHTPQGGRRVPDREIHQAIEKAQRDCPTHQRGAMAYRWHNPRPVAKTFDASAFMAARLAEAEWIGETDIWEASPVCIDWPPEQDAVELLTRIYNPNDVLFVGNQYGAEIKPVADWLAYFKTGHSIPPHIIPNPLTGQKAQTKDGKLSVRADACVKSFRFAVAEFDGFPREDQLRFWWAVNLPICALIDSGGKSLHAWIRIDDVETGEGWSNLVENQLFGRYLISLGCDSACRNEARLSRMPGHFRTEKGRWQRLLYLAPEGRAVSWKH